MYKTSKKALIIGLSIVLIVFVLFIFDEVIYDYRSNSNIQIMAVLFFLFVLTFGLIFNIQTLKISTLFKEKEEILDDIEPSFEKNEMKKIRTKIILCYINNIILFIILLTLSSSLMMYILDDLTDYAIYDPEPLFFGFLSTITIITSLVAILDIKVSRRMKAEKIK